MSNLLYNGGFDADWGDDRSHRCLIFPEGEPYETDVGNIFTPAGWMTWFRHVPDIWDQPEVRDARNAERVHGGEKATLLFTFFRKHDAGFLQQVQVKPGETLRLTAWAHAWSNHSGGDGFPHPDDGRWSEGAGYDVVVWEQGTLPPGTGKPQQDAKYNFLFRVGLDPTGGTDPYSDTVVWGTGWHIYNDYCQQLEVEAQAEGAWVTVFLRSTTAWAFKHNDAYWDDVELVVVEDETPHGAPRIQYERSYVLLPPKADATWAMAVAEATWDEHRYTIGGSADDAGIGDLDVRQVVAVNPDQWTGDLAAFFEEYYPGAEMIPVTVVVPDELAGALASLDLTIENMIDQLPTNPDSPWYPWEKRVPDDISAIFVHHSAGALSSDFETVRSIAYYHTSANGKNRPGICYTYVIAANGHIWQTAALDDVVFGHGSADHPGDENLYGCGVCLLGYFTEDKHGEPTAEQRLSLDALIEYLERSLGRTLNVWGHKDVIGTQCPGDWWPPADRPHWGWGRG